MNPPFLLLLFPFLTLTLSLSQAAGSGLDTRPAVSLERKLEHLRNNSLLPHPDPTPTVFKEEEINAESVNLQEDPGLVTRQALRIDFDKLKAGRCGESLVVGFYRHP